MIKTHKPFLKATIALVTMASIIAPAYAMPLSPSMVKPLPATNHSKLDVVPVQNPVELPGSRGFGGAGNDPGFGGGPSGGFGGGSEGGFVSDESGSRGYGGAGNNPRGGFGGYGGSTGGGFAGEGSGSRGYGGAGNNPSGGYGGYGGGFVDEGSGSRGYGGAGNNPRGGYGGYQGVPPSYGFRDGYYNGHRGYRERRPGYREYNGYWFPLAAFATGAILGGALNNNRAAPAYGGSHLEWCSNRWRSYRAYDNSYQPNTGPRRTCVSPFMR